MIYPTTENVTPSDIVKLSTPFDTHPATILGPVAPVTPSAVPLDISVPLLSVYTHWLGPIFAIDTEPVIATPFVGSYRDIPDPEE